MGDDRWWRGFDAVVAENASPGSRILDVGCGDGALVERLVALGFDAIGVDPSAPDHPRLRRERVEDAVSIGPFEVVCAVMSLHHADLDALLPAVRRLLLPGGRLLVEELAWEAYDERAASWLADRDRSGADNSVAAWRREHAGLHPSSTIRDALEAGFELHEETERPYLARMLGRPELEEREQALIAARELPALGRRYCASHRTG